MNEIRHVSGEETADICISFCKLYEKIDLIVLVCVIRP